MQRAGLVTGFRMDRPAPRLQSRGDWPLGCIARFSAVPLPSRPCVSFHAAAALLILLACSTPVYAQEGNPSILDRAIDLANGSALVAHSADLSSTLWCLSAKTCLESNPVLLPHVKSPKVYFSLKMGVALGSYVAKVKTKHAHPKWTLAFAVAENVAFFWIAHRNYQVHQRATR